MKNKFYTLFLILFFIGLQSKSQHFVVIDAATPVPFTVTLQGKIYQSSQEGHLIIPKLNDTTYTFIINTIASKGRDYNFTFNMNRRDHGWILKPLGQTQFELYDWQTETSIPSFDPTQSTQTIKAAPMPAPTAAATTKVEIPAINISLWKDDTDALQRSLSYIIKEGTTFIDTVQVSIKLEIPSNPSSVAPLKLDSLKEQPIKPTPIVTTPSPIIKMVNSDCKLMASEKEIDKLRMKMLHNDEPEERLETSRGFLKNRCITTMQTRSLAELFFTPDNIYKFLDIAYPHVSDSDQFSQLIDLLTDEHNRTRFKAMVRIQ